MTAYITSETTDDLKRAYLSLLEIADSAPHLAQQCGDVLFALGTLEMALNADGCSQAPYHNLKEYFLYLEDTQRPDTDGHQRQQAVRQMEKFKRSVRSWAQSEPSTPAAGAPAVEVRPSDPETQAGTAGLSS
ncbi:hypothetical protein DQ239_11850 [Blastococcus sp. TF02-09]|uniref:hypothetical protein n=1 Tax=Blastococcus sp. TF02-09 TaxID=2250576 RepID=UPI000DE93EFD|nr:hypothetical protein [Blastococcus sp. TF02-9]RBY76885.1 hypothetical protein DQ239_11850 [Blastococcus sp. TF02-9]